MIGVAVGQTNVFFFDAEGRQIAGFDIAVTRDLNGIRAALEQVLPYGDIRVDGIGATGSCCAARVASRPRRSRPSTSWRVASARHGDQLAAGSKVVNGIIMRGRDQVMLKVTVAEVQRDVIKQLGIDMDGASTSAPRSSTSTTSNPFSRSASR